VIELLLILAGYAIGLLTYHFTKLYLKRKAHKRWLHDEGLLDVDQLLIFDSEGNHVCKFERGSSVPLKPNGPPISIEWDNDGVSNL